MKVVVKKQYYFEIEDRKKFKLWCIKNNTNMVEVSKTLGISCSYLNAVLNGIRAITEEMIAKLSMLGFKVKL